MGSKRLSHSQYWIGYCVIHFQKKLRAPDLRGAGLLICPTGSLLIRVSSPLCKNILLRHLIETDLLIPPSHPTEGRIMIVTNAGRDAVDAAAFCARGDRRAGSYEPVSDRKAS